VQQALVSFFAIIDPVGNIIVFYLFTRGFVWRQKALAASVAVLASWAMLLAFSVGGERVLDLLGISFESFRIAAGRLLMPPAYNLVMYGEPTHVEGEQQQLDALDFALVPLATPLIAGPGALAATTAFAITTLGDGETIAAFTAVLAVTFAAFLAADLIFRVLGMRGSTCFRASSASMLFAIAVDCAGRHASVSRGDELPLAI
jgi:multiple antibiotic resistance protein